MGFNQNEKDTITSLQSVKGALVTLGKHNQGAAFIQKDALVHLTHTIRSQVKSQSTFMFDALPHQRRLLQSILRQPEGFVSLLQQQPGMDASGATSYNSQ